jgi:hypothetical protein
MKVALNTAGRVGSTWMGAILERLLDTKYVPLFMDGDKVIAEDFTLFKMHNEDPIKIHNLGFKQVLLVRNIYDTIISRILFERMIASMYVIDEAMPEDMKTSRTYILTLSPDLTPQEYVDIFFENRKDVIEIWVQQALMYINFEHPDMFKTSYEEMVNDCIDVINRLCIFLEISKTAEEIQQIADDLSFVNMTGRDPGEEDVFHHERKGIVGDYLNYFSEEQIEFIDGISH